MTSRVFSKVSAGSRGTHPACLSVIFPQHQSELGAPTVETALSVLSSFMDAFSRQSSVIPYACFSPADDRPTKVLQRKKFGYVLKTNQ